MGIFESLKPMEHDPLGCMDSPPRNPDLCPDPNAVGSPLGEYIVLGIAATFLLAPAAYTAFQVTRNYFRRRSGTEKDQLK